MQTTMTLLLWFSLSVSGMSGQGKTMDGMGVGNFLLPFEDADSLNQPIVTDLQMVRFSLDATLNDLVAPFAAMFLLLAATLIASGRGFAQPGLLPPGFPSEGNSRCQSCCHGRFQSPGWMLAATFRDFFERVFFDGRYGGCCD